MRGRKPGKFIKVKETASFGLVSEKSKCYNRTSRASNNSLYIGRKTKSKNVTVKQKKNSKRKVREVNQMSKEQKVRKLYKNTKGKGK